MHRGELIAHRGTRLADCHRQPGIATQDVKVLGKQPAILAPLARPVRQLAERQRDRPAGGTCPLASGKLPVHFEVKRHEEGGDPRSHSKAGPVPHHLGTQTKPPEILGLEGGKIQNHVAHRCQSRTLRNPHDQVIVLDTVTRRTREIWPEGYDIDGPRSARRRRSLLGIG